MFQQTMMDSGRRTRWMALVLRQTTWRAQEVSLSVCNEAGRSRWWSGNKERHAGDGPEVENVVETDGGPMRTVGAGCYSCPMLSASSSTLG